MKDEEGIWCLRIKIASDATIWELKTTKATTKKQFTKDENSIKSLTFNINFSGHFFNTLLLASPGISETFFNFLIHYAVK